MRWSPSAVVTGFLYVFLVPNVCFNHSTMRTSTIVNSSFSSDCLKSLSILITECAICTSAPSVHYSWTDGRDTPFLVIMHFPAWSICVRFVALCLLSRFHTTSLLDISSSHRSSFELFWPRYIWLSSFLLSSTSRSSFFMIERAIPII